MHSCAVMVTSDTDRLALDLVYFYISGEGDRGHTMYIHVVACMYIVIVIVIVLLAYVGVIGVPTKRLVNCLPYMPTLYTSEVVMARVQSPVAAWPCQLRPLSMV